MGFGTEKNPIRIDFFAHKYALNLISFLISRRLTMGNDEEVVRSEGETNKECDAESRNQRAAARNDQRVEKKLGETNKKRKSELKLDSYGYDLRWMGVEGANGYAQQANISENKWS